MQRRGLFYKLHVKQLVTFIRQRGTRIERHLAHYIDAMAH
jgi:hypothetical protein